MTGVSLSRTLPALTWRVVIIAASPASRNIINLPACFGGTTGVGRTCEVKDGATVTLEWRQNANQPGAGVIPVGHRGPCAVYMKKVGTAMTDTATGDGWFKLWDKGYADDWCTMSLIASNGLMTFDLPTGTWQANHATTFD